MEIKICQKEFFPLFLLFLTLDPDSNLDPDLITLLNPYSLTPAESGSITLSAREAFSTDDKRCSMVMLKRIFSVSYFCENFRFNPKIANERYWVPALNTKINLKDIKKEKIKIQRTLGATL
jgi:hypothetical protein